MPKSNKITNRSLDNLATTTYTSISLLHHRSQAKLVVVEFVVVDRREIVVLRTQRTSAPEQQPSPITTTVDRKRLALF
jgi:hypothetical protein